jgi:F-type H+-transporting ATPase subunit gamma
MANLKEVRDRIQSVNNTQQITKAMKMVAASKLRKAQDAIVKMRPYANKLDQILRNILANLEGDANTSFGVERPVEHACLVVITSNRGLAGAFNTNISKAAMGMIEGEFSELAANGKLTVLCIGKKGYDYLRRRQPDLAYDTRYLNLFDDLVFEQTQEVADYLMDAFEYGTYDKVVVAYSRFKNAAVQMAEAVQFLPVARLEVEDEAPTMRADYIFEPDKSELLEYLVPSILKNTFHKFNLDTHAAEHGARMTAMDKATENAQELLKELKLDYNKARQEAITNQILEIVSGAAALENG